MLLTDTHTHLYLEDFASDRDLLIKEAMEKGVQRFFLPNIDSSSVDDLHRLSEKYPEQCFPMMGLHPCSVNENWKDEIALVEKLLAERKYYAVGEIGMDLYWDKTFVPQQEEVFRIQIDLANKYKLPVSIHSRESFEELYTILLDKKKESPCGVFHCFTGNADQARRAIDLGFYLGIGGVVTFKNSGLDKVIAEIGFQHLVLETDSPYLAPVPFRGKRNLPEYIVKVAEKISEVSKVSIDEVVSVTTANSKVVFGV